MKTSVKITASAVLLLSMACGTKKSTQSKMENTQQEMATKGTDENKGETLLNESDDRSVDSDDLNESSLQEEPNESTQPGKVNISATPASMVNEVGDSRMYTELQMTDDQIQEFENAMKNFKTQRQNTPSGEMMGTLLDERDRQLEKILSPEQYSAYQSWKTDN